MAARGGAVGSGNCATSRKVAVSILSLLRFAERVGCVVKGVQACVQQVRSGKSFSVVFTIQCFE